MNLVRGNEWGQNPKYIFFFYPESDEDGLMFTIFLNGQTARLLMFGDRPQEFHDIQTMEDYINERWESYVRWFTPT